MSTRPPSLTSGGVLTRAATAVALLTAPAFFLVLYESNHLSLIASLIITVLSVLVFRGLVEVIARKLIPSPACTARTRVCATRTRGSSSSREGSLGRRHAGRLRAASREALCTRSGGDRSSDEAPRRRSACGRPRARRLRRRSRVDGYRDLGGTGFPDDLSASLPSRHPRSAQDSRNRAGRTRCRSRWSSLPSATCARPRVSPVEEELRRLHQPHTERLLDRRQPERSSSSEWPRTSATTPRSAASSRAASRFASSRMPRKISTTSAWRPARPSGGKTGSRSPPQRRPLKASS